MKSLYGEQPEKANQLTFNFLFGLDKVRETSVHLAEAKKTKFVDRKGLAPPQLRLGTELKTYRFIHTVHRN